MKRLVLIRHGESTWNRENRFAGWADVPLTERGQHEAIAVARLLLRENFSFHVAFTSVLQRAIKTLWLILEAMDLVWIPVHRSWRLNERHYGLQGLNRGDAGTHYDVEQLKRWRRSYP